MGDSVLLDVLIDTRVPVRAGRTRRNVMERFGVFHSVLLAQFSVVRQDEFANVVAIGNL